MSDEIKYEGGEYGMGVRPEDIVQQATLSDLIIIRLRAALRGTGLTGEQIAKIIDDAD